MCLTRGFAISTDESTSSDVFTITNVGYLILSSTLGILVGDVLWLEALRLLGAKHVIVIDSLKPFMAAILGRVGLDEVLLGPAWGGMVLTVIGVGVVAWEEQRITSAASQNDNDDGRSENAGKENGTVAETKATERTALQNEVGDGVPQQPDGSAVGPESDEIINNMEENSMCNNDPTHQSSLIKDTSAVNTNATNKEHKRYKRGYVCAIVNVLADSLGSFLTKKHGVGMTTWSINLIRFGFAGVVMIGISVGMRVRRKFCVPSLEQPKSKKSIEQRTTSHDNVDDTTIGMPKATAVTNKKPSPSPKWFELPSSLSRIGWMQITVGVAFVTFLCPALSNYALFQIALGLAVSLGSIGPLYGLLLDWPFKGRRPTVWGVVGVALAIAGVVVLCVWGTSS